MFFGFLGSKDVVKTSRSSSHSWLITRFVTRLLRRVSLVEQELLTHPEHLSSPPVFSTVRVTRSLVFCFVYCFIDRFCCFVLFLLTIVLSVDIWILITSLWYLQFFLECSSYEHALWRLFQKPNKFDIYVCIYFINWKWRYIPKAHSTPLFEMELFKTCMSFFRMFIKSEYVLLFNVKYFGKI